LEHEYRPGQRTGSSEAAPAVARRSLAVLLLLFKFVVPIVVPGAVLVVVLGSLGCAVAIFCGGCSSAGRRGPSAWAQCS
jgi:hypothetical protein